MSSPEKADKPSKPARDKQPKLLDQVRAVARLKHYSIRTEQSYVQWIKRFILFHRKRHPAEMAEPEIRQFLSDLAVRLHVSASTQTVALSALLFLYRDVLKHPLPFIDDIERAKPSHHLPVVFTRAEVQTVLAHLAGTHLLLASLLYGAGYTDDHSAAGQRYRLQSNRSLFAMAKAVCRITMLPGSINSPWSITCAA